MNTTYEYIIADHVRASCFIIADGVRPSGKQRGYILRRLMRRALSASLQLNIDISDGEYISELVDAAVKPYKNAYPELTEAQPNIVEYWQGESKKYLRGIQTGKKQWKKYLAQVEGKTKEDHAHKAWDLYQTHGVPIEVSTDILEQEGFEFDQAVLEKLIQDHQSLSQSQSKGQFKSGLGSDSQKARSLHTVTHILHQILRDTLGQETHQMGSAITDEKARFDFTSDRKLDQGELEDLTGKIQSVIDKGVSMSSQEMSPQEAKDLGAIGLFGEKYGDVVTVYTLQDADGKVYSREFCGGPHIENTQGIGTFRVIKQKSIGAGLKRIEFTVE